VLKNIEWSPKAEQMSPIKKNQDHSNEIQSSEDWNNNNNVLGQSLMTLHEEHSFESKPSTYSKSKNFLNDAKQPNKSTRRHSFPHRLIVERRTRGPTSINRNGTPQPDRNFKFDWTSPGLPRQKSLAPQTAAG
jgi:hypothetical protein